MAKIVGLLAFLALSLSAVTSEELKFSATHSAIITKFHPIVKQFSSEISNKLGESDKLSAAVYDVITKNLAVQVDEYVATTNGTDKLKGGMCCQCKTCDRKCRECGKSCCCKGSGGCSCKSCVSGSFPVDLPEVTDMTSSRQLWSVSTKDLLVRELGTVVSEHSASANAKCCVCRKCTGYVPACGVPVCCKSGSLCVCKSCGTASTERMDSVSNLVALTPEADAAVQKVEDLVDELSILMSVL